MAFIKTIRSFLLCHYLRLRGASVGRNFQVNGSIEIVLRDGGTLRNLTIGNDVSLDGKTYIRIRKQGRISLGNGVRVGKEVWLVAANHCEITIGENTILGSYSIFNGGHGIKIGANCIFAAFVYVNTSDHGFKRGELIQKQLFFGASVEIGEDVWMGGHVFVSKGVRIGNGCVIGAGAVVLKDVPDYKIAVGNPCKALKDRE